MTAEHFFKTFSQGMGATALLSACAAVMGLVQLAAGADGAGAMANPVRLAKDGYFRLADGSLYVPLGGIHGNVIPLSALKLNDQQRAKVEGKLWNGFVDFADADEDMLDQWFKQCADNGINCLRLFPRANVGVDVLDLCGKLNPDLQAAFSRAFKVGQKYNIRFLLMIIAEPDRLGYGQKRALEKFVLPRYSAEELATLTPAQKRFIVDRKLVSTREFFTDPDVLACQKLYLQQALEWVARERQIYALEIYNEQGWWQGMRNEEGRRGKAFTFPIEQEEIRWTAEIVKAIKQRLPNMPVCISHPGFGVTAYEPLKWSAQTGVDFYSTHMYAGLCGDVGQVDFSAVTGATARVLDSGVINFNGEWGILDHAIPEPIRQRGHRDAIWLALMERCPGFLQWEHVLLSENRWPNKVMNALPKGFSPQAPDLAVEIGAAYREFHLNTRYPLYSAEKPPEAFTFIRQKYQDKNIQMIYAAYMHSLDLGVPARFTISADPASQPAATSQPAGKTMTMEEFARLDGSTLARPIQAVGGYQLAYVKDKNSLTYVAYLRSRTMQRFDSQVLGVPAEAPLSLKLDLPAGQYTVRMINLDQDKLDRQTVDAKATVNLSEKTSDDYVLVITPAGVKLALD